MGINNFYFKELKEIVDQNFFRKTNLRALCLGYPDLLTDKDFLEECLGKDFVNDLPIDPFPNQVRQWHKMPESFIPYDPIYILNSFGFEVTVFDAVKHRNIETIVDLNDPLTNEFDQKFDLVIDTGTLEHCFNVGIAFKNICQTLKQNGIFMTAAPITKLDHGYWNFGTIVYKDIFSSNGFEIIQQRYFRQGIELESISRKKVPLLTIVFCIAQRKNIVPWIWPVQEKYK